MAEMSATQVRLVRLALVVVLCVVWELYARFVSTSSLIAGPSDVVLAWWPKVAGDPRVHRRRCPFPVDHRRHGGAP